MPPRLRLKPAYWTVPPVPKSSFRSVSSVSRPKRDAASIPTLQHPSPADFAKRLLNDGQVEAELLRPWRVKGLMENWPAMTKWQSITSLVSDETAHLSVPVELGPKNVGYNIDASNSYIQSGTRSQWRRQDLPFSVFVEFVERGLLEAEGISAYMSQVSIDDIPSLKEDVHLPIAHARNLSAPPHLWVGSKDTYTPIHRDILGHNLLFQILGTKIVRLYHPSEKSNLYISMDPFLRNTSLIPFDYEVDGTKWPLFNNISTWYETRIKPGEAVFVPKGWYHSVRALDKSISVNTWFL